MFKQKNNIALAVIKVSNKRFWNIDRERHKESIFREIYTFMETTVRNSYQGRETEPARLLLQCVPRLPEVYCE